VKIPKVIYFVHAFSLYFSTPAVRGDWLSDKMATGTNKSNVLSVEGKVKVI
jgi:hypothetical protein